MNKITVTLLRVLVVYGLLIEKEIKKKLILLSCEAEVSINLMITLNIFSWIILFKYTRGLVLLKMLFRFARCLIGGINCCAFETFLIRPLTN